MKEKKLADGGYGISELAESQAEPGYVRKETKIMVDNSLLKVNIMQASQMDNSNKGLMDSQLGAIEEE